MPLPRTTNITINPITKEKEPNDQNRPIYKSQSPKTARSSTKRPKRAKTHKSTKHTQHTQLTRQIPIIEDSLLDPLKKAILANPTHGMY